MTIDTDHLDSCVRTLGSDHRWTATDRPNRAASIKRSSETSLSIGYELTQETSFKLLKRALQDFGHGRRKLDATPVKEILRLSALHGLMTLEEVERWFAYRDNRNDTAHDYGEGFANETLKLLPAFIVDVRTLEAILRARFGEDSDHA
ncbi:MAG: nucleotidyltransferase substrate binding protein [Gammaproteobacteria bacterium]